MSREQKPGLDYEEMADLLSLKSNTLRQKVKRGRIPAPDVTDDRDLKWSIPKIVEMADAGYFSDDIIIPPHWREPDPNVTSEFRGVIPTKSGHPVITFEIAGIIVGLAPGRSDGPRLEGDVFPEFFHSDDCDFIYAERSGLTGVVTLMPVLASSQRPGLTVPPVRGSGVGMATQTEDNDYQEVWARLSATLGLPLPHWPSRLFRLEDIWAWNPNRTEPSPVTPLPQNERLYNALSAIEPFVEDDHRDFVSGRKMSEITRGLAIDIEQYARRQYRDRRATAVVPNVSPDLDVDDEMWPSTFDGITLREGSPTHMSIIRDSAEFLTEERRKVPYRTPNTGRKRRPIFSRTRVTRGDLATMMLHSPKKPDPEFSRTLLGIAAGGDAYEWSILDGSDARVAESDGEVIFIPPTRITGIGKIVWISVPEMHMDNYPLICDERGRVWPMPINRHSLGGGYISGYNGGSPVDFASAVVFCLSHDGELNSDQIKYVEAQQRVIPEIGHEVGEALKKVFRRPSRALGETLTREELVSMFIGAM